MNPELEKLHQAIQSDPNNPQNHCDRGDYYYKSQQWEFAINDYTTAIQIDRNNPIFFVNLGKAYAAYGDENNAEANYKAAIALDPKYAKLLSQDN